LRHNGLFPLLSKSGGKIPPPPPHKKDALVILELYILNCLINQIIYLINQAGSLIAESRPEQGYLHIDYRHFIYLFCDFREVPEHGSGTCENPNLSSATRFRTIRSPVFSYWKFESDTENWTGQTFMFLFSNFSYSGLVFQQLGPGFNSLDPGFQQLEPEATAWAPVEQLGPGSIAWNSFRAIGDLGL